jgi:uncharacterized protein (TIGR02246 family)
MKTHLVALVGLAISFAVPTFAQEKDAVDPQTLQQLDAKIKKYDDAINKNDAAAIAALYTEDAVFLTDRGPVYGPQAVEKWYADVFKAWHPKNHTGPRDPNSARFIGTTEFVALYGKWSESGQGPNGETIEIKGYWFAIDTRVGDAWKIRMLAYNLTPAPATQATSAEAK